MLKLNRASEGYERHRSSLLGSRAYTDLPALKSIARSRARYSFGIKMRVALYEHAITSRTVIAMTRGGPSIENESIENEALERAAR